MCRLWRVFSLLLVACLAVAVAIYGAPPSYAADFFRGDQAYVDGDFDTARNELTPLAEKGDATSQFLLGLMHYHGKGGTRDFGKAFSLFERAAARGFRSARFNVAYMLVRGEGVERDQEKALKIFRRLAQLGDKEARYILSAYEHLDGVVYPDVSSALQRYIEKAQEGDAEASFRACVAYHFILQVMEEAVPWCEYAARAGHASAQARLGLMYLAGDGIERDVDKAMSWYEKAAEKGLAHAQKQLALIHAAGGEAEKAFYWAGKAAEQKNFEGVAILGLLYAKGVGVERDDARALELLREAAYEGEFIAQASLASIYLHARGVEVDLAEAAKWAYYAEATGKKGFMEAYGDLQLEPFTRTRTLLSQFDSKDWGEEAERRIEAFRTEKKDSGNEENRCIRENQHGVFFVPCR